MIQCSDLSGRPKAPELGPVTVLRRIAGVRDIRRNTTTSEQDFKQESSPDCIHPSLLFGCRQDECQTLFLISKYRSGLQHPGVTHAEKKLRAAPRSHPLPSAPALCLYRLRHRQGLESCAPMFNRLHQSLFLVLVTFQQRQKRRAVIAPSSA